jgi:hypothetical protein
MKLFLMLWSTIQHSSHRRYSTGKMPTLLLAWLSAPKQTYGTSTARSGQAVWHQSHKLVPSPKDRHSLLTCGGDNPRVNFVNTTLTVCSRRGT